jgi:hypothetical protein
MNTPWPWHVHLILILWVCYALALFLLIPTEWDKMFPHIFMLSVPPWFLGRAMAGAYAKKELP